MARGERRRQREGPFASFYVPAADTGAELRRPGLLSRNMKRLPDIMGVLHFQVPAHMPFSASVTVSVSTPHTMQPYTMKTIAWPKRCP